MRVAYTIRGTGVFYYNEHRITAVERANQGGHVGGADLSMQKQRTECKEVVQRKRCLRTDILQMAKEDIRHGKGTTGTAVCRGNAGYVQQ